MQALQQPPGRAAADARARPGRRYPPRASPGGRRADTTPTAPAPRLRRVARDRPSRPRRYRRGDRSHAGAVTRAWTRTPLHVPTARGARAGNRSARGRDHGRPNPRRRQRARIAAPGRIRSAFRAVASTFRPLARRRPTIASTPVTRRRRARASPLALGLRAFRPARSEARLHRRDTTAERARAPSGPRADRRCRGPRPPRHGRARYLVGSGPTFTSIWRRFSLLAGIVRHAQEPCNCRYDRHSTERRARGAPCCREAKRSADRGSAGGGFACPSPRRSRYTARAESGAPPARPHRPSACCSRCSG